MAWIESHTVLMRHRKVIELAKDLRLKPVYCLGHLHALWHAALEQQEDGDLSSWSDELIAEVSGFDGSAPQYVSLLQLHGWLDGKVLHDWLDYAGKYLTAKYRTANPKKLRQILFRHKSVNSRTKVGRSPIGLSNHKVGSEKGESPRGETRGKLSFESFWSAYPHKVAKGQAEKAWTKLKPTEELISAILTAIEAQKKWRGARVGNSKLFTPEWKHPATWLNAKAWEDVLEGNNGASSPAPIKKPPALEDPERNLTPEQRRANIERVRDMLAGIGKGA